MIPKPFLKHINSICFGFWLFGGGEQKYNFVQFQAETHKACYFIGFEVAKAINLSLAFTAQ